VPLALDSQFRGAARVLHCVNRVCRVDGCTSARKSLGDLDIKDQGLTEAHGHKLVDDKLKSIAHAANIQNARSPSSQFQKELDHLKALSGISFEATYLRGMDDIHKKDGAALIAARGGIDLQRQIEVRLIR
jgi:hypothetical protein